LGDPFDDRLKISIVGLRKKTIGTGKPDGTVPGHQTVFQNSLAVLAGDLECGANQLPLHVPFG
jgi:hypothetical protein